MEPSESIKHDTEPPPGPVSKKFRVDEDRADLAEAEVKPHLFAVQSEPAVGITQYLGKHSGFRGVLKHRYSDFLVNEITLSKEVVRLTHFDLPEDVYPEDPVNPTDVLSAEDIEKVTKLSAGETKEEVQLQVTNLDKLGRTKIHQCFRQNYKNLKTFTKKVGEDNFIIIQNTKIAGNSGNERWPACRPDFTHFVLYKENVDTMDATRIIANYFKMNPNVYTYAGTKDKRGKSCQYISAYHLKAEKLLQLNNTLRDIKVGNVSYQKNTIKLGDLYGNRFTIILRNITKTGDELDEIMKGFVENGFINYFGLQRFGTSSVPTQDIGKCLVLEDWERAVQLILEPRENPEPDDVKMCRDIWWNTGNPVQAFEVLHRKNSIEGMLLKGLASYAPNDHLNAFSRIPRNTRLLYLHSYQSYVWNNMVSFRLSRLGLEPVEGDLYIINKGEKDVDKKTADIITKEILEAGTVTIYDIVLPLPGHSVDYPKNQVSNWYRDWLWRDGIHYGHFRARVKEYSLGGCYRHILSKPEDVKWETIQYNDANQALVASDHDKLQPEFELKVENTGNKTALKLEFSLPSSAYATMAVREIMKMETTRMIDTSMEA